MCLRLHDEAEQLRNRQDEVKDVHGVLPAIQNFKSVDRKEETVNLGSHLHIPAFPRHARETVDADGSLDLFCRFEDLL